MTELRPFVIVANRLPVQRAGRSGWEISPGGLVSALSSLTTQRHTAWVGWPGGRSARTEPFAHGKTWLVPVPLSTQEVDRYYEGFSNGALWPLFHDMVTRPQYHRSWWDAYLAVNQRFAEQAAASADRNGTVWVHDYQLMLVPEMLRALRPDLRIGFFNHIPFPPPELFLQLPWRQELLDGMLGADLVGLQTPGDALNVTRLASILGHRNTHGVVHVGRRRCQVDDFPISVDFTQLSDSAEHPDVAARAEQLRADLGMPRRILLGVDRLDYTKGITVRLRAFQELLKDGAIDPEEVVFVQVAVPSRERIGSYAEERRRVNNIVGEINGRFGRIGRPSVHLISRSLPMTELQPLYRTADVMLVTPVRDGMNLVAKEFVASCVNESGVLILSEFAGAAHELSDALKVNPFDIDGVKAALVEALAMSPEEQQRRMRSMRALVKERDVHAWALGFIQRLEKRRRS